MSEIKNLSLKPIGYVHTRMRLKFDAPHQPDLNSPQESIIELVAGHNFEAALEDLSGFDRIWLIWWFHLNDAWRPKVLPPRGTKKRRGVFATRSPHRPNPLGMTCVPLISIKGRKLKIGSNDLVDGTPIFDIKPYISTVDAFPEAKKGWIEELEKELAQEAKFQVKISAHAQEQLDWLKKNWDVEFIDKTIAILQRDPTPHRTRRITTYRDQTFKISCGAWRVVFSLDQNQVTIVKICPGYPLYKLEADLKNKIIERQAQIALAQKWSAE